MEKLISKLPLLTFIVATWKLCSE